MRVVVEALADLESGRAVPPDGGCIGPVFGQPLIRELIHGVRRSDRRTKPRP